MITHVFGVTYNGAPYNGWQRQLQQATVQGEIEAALARIANEPVTLSVAGRTDAGVHATGQVAAFSTNTKRPLHDWHRGLNALTSDNIHIDWIQLSPQTFHPRYSATARRYVYVYHDIGYSHPHLPGQVWGCAPLDADAMHRAGQGLVGEHDFSSFRGAGCQSVTPLRRVNQLQVRRQGVFVLMEIEANAFLLHMVRNIARALHDVGRGAPSDSPVQWLQCRDRSVVGATAPPCGLYLTRVLYPGFDLPAPADISFLSSAK
ncbi:MAG: tRNA pseudouridine(38-40) synthase TruA [bacterium]